VRIWRVCRKRYVKVAFNGEGAKSHPGRWNKHGEAAGYGATVPSLAYLEYLTTVDLEDIPDDVCLASVDIPDDLVSSVDLRHLPRDWRNVPSPDSTRELGHARLAGKSALALRVPSVVLPSTVYEFESNLVTNPAHPRYSDLMPPSVVDISTDARLFGPAKGRADNGR